MDVPERCPVQDVVWLISEYAVEVIMMSGRNLVGPEWLSQHLSDPAMVIVDCRFDLARPQAGRLQYQEGHIPGAVYLDLEADLSAPKQAHGGRHPLPDIPRLAQTLGSMGVDHEVTVVAYDDQGGSMAARLWWMMRYMGHTRTKVLDGGWAAWRKAGYPVTTDVRPAAPRTFVPRVRSELLIGIEELQRRRREGRPLLIDSRAPERYRGEVEPLDPVAGHIPGATNLPWTENAGEAGRLKPAPLLRERFKAAAEGTGQPIVYCGSGVTACMNLLAMDEAGIDGVLYLGGWSDWCSYPENPVAKEQKDGR